MKKVLAVLLSAGLIASAVLFAGCSDIRINGDFSTAATQEEVTALAATVSANQDKWFGDATAEGWAYGMEITSNAKLEMKISGGGMEMTTKSDASIDLDVAYETQTVSGKVKVNAESKVSALGQSESSGVSFDGKAYLDNTGLYFDGSAREYEGDEDFKLSGKYRYPNSAASSMGIELPTAASITGVILGALQDENVTVYIDDGGEETKVKISYDVDAFMEEYLSDYTATETEQLLLDKLNFEAMDVYLSFMAETGLLTGYGMVVKANLSEVTIGSGDEAARVSMSISSSGWYMKGDVTVQAPSDLDSYQTPSV